MNYCETLYNVPASVLDRIVFSEVETDHKLSYKDLQDRIRQWVQFYIQNGICSGNVVSLHIYNSIDFICAHMGAQYSGIVSCLLDPLTQVKSLPYFLEQTNSCLLITHLDLQNFPMEVTNLCAVINIEDASKQAHTNNSEVKTHKMHEWDINVTSYIYYTSGTTSLPKGVPLNYKNHQNFFKIADLYWKPSDSRSRHICFVPFSHGFGSIFLIPWTIRTHASMFIMRSFHPIKVEETIRNHSITHIYGVPAHYQQLLKYTQSHESLKKLEMAFCAASKLDLSTGQEWKKVTGNHLHEGYGLIETTGGVIWRVHEEPTETGHVGVCPPTDLIEIGIVDVNDNPIVDQTEGEIVVRGDSVTQGYLNMPEENQRIFKNGWFHTGDKGLITKDRQLIMTGRIKDIINIAGIKISPFEVETVLNTHPDVQTSAVVSSEDKLYGEIVKAFVICKNNANISERELVKYCALHLINFQVPKRIVFMDDFPKNNMGKVDRKQLRSA